MTSAATTGRGIGRRRRARRSVLVHLVVLAIVPTLGMPAFAGLFTAGHVADAATAREIGQGMQLVRQLDDLRVAVSWEATASGIAAVAGRYGLTVAQVEELVGEGVVVPLGPARAETDRAAASVGVDHHTAPLYAAFETELVEVRRLADVASAPSGPSGPGDTAMWDVYQAYSRLQETPDALQRLAVRDVVTGQHGSGSPALLTAVAELEAVAGVAGASYRQGTLLEGLIGAPTEVHRTEIQGELRLANAGYAEQAGRLAGQLSDELRSSWDRLAGDADVQTYQAVLADLAEMDPGEPVTPATPGVADVASVALVSIDGFRSLVADAVDDGVAIAEEDQREAEARARTAVGATTVLLVVTATLVVLVGGSIRRRLDNLATAAERLRAGRFEAIEVGGPREVAVAAEALNDAVVNFQRVALHAEILASGDLDDPELREPAPGELGAAVHASVERIVAAVREGERLRDELAHQATHDPLTGLPNRAETERLLRQSLARVDRAGVRVAVLFVDLDDFKRCNDTLGHAAGDHVLRTAADRMRAVVRPGDTVGRLGGDEFVVVVEPTDAGRAAVDIAGRIVAALAEPVPYADGTVEVGGTVGVAESDGVADAAELLRRADRAMYRAKARSRGSVEVFGEPAGGRAGANRDASPAPG